MRLSLLTFITLIVTSANNVSAQTTPLPDPGVRAMELAWMHPTKTPAIAEKNGYLEVGFRLGMELRRKINNYLDGREVPDRINPFDPADLDVRVTFSRINPENGSVEEGNERIGFWYREFERDYRAPNPDDWNHREIPNLFNFRARYAPKEIGLYTVTAMVIERQSDTSFTNTTTFEVVESNREGFLELDQHNRYFTRNGKGFFPVGQNLPTPTCRPEVDSVCSALYCAGKEAWCHGRIMGPYGFQVFETEMKQLANSGANYMRFLIAPWNLEIEFEALNNYDKRMHCAWETDRIIQLADSLGILLHFNMQIHFPLEDPSGYGMWHWDFGDLPCFAYDNPYCYAREFEFARPIDFIRSDAARYHYKNRLRYMIARYGHATSIGVFELFSEANNIGDGYELDENCQRVEGRDRKKPYYNEPGYAAAIADWHNDLAQYIKQELKHTDHLLAVNYTGPPAFSLGDRSFYSPDVDVAAFNFYNLAVDKYYRSSTIAEDFRNNRNRRKPTDFNPPDINKPLMFSESGPGPEDIARCDEDMRWIKTVWLSAFTGLAGTAMNWSNQYNFQLWEHLGRLRDFIGDFDFAEQRVAPYRAESSDRRFELVALRSTRGQRRAIGAVHNRSVNFYTQSKDPTSICRDSTWLTDEIINPALRQAVSKTYNLRERVARIENMGTLVRYRVQFVDILNGSIVKESEVRSGISGALNIEHPVLDAQGSPIYVFRAERLKDTPR
jgi:hypothetical protein